MSDHLLSAHNRDNDAVPYSRPETPNSHAAQQIGFVGLGAMGYLMAHNLANHRASVSPLLVWNRTIEKSEKLLNALSKDKIRIARDLAQVARECDVIITSLANDDVVKSVYEQFLETLKVGFFQRLHELFPGRPHSSGSIRLQ
ncbi:putative NAD-P-binding protein [Lyophyllum shimeji]|uniref:NAD-P-binding protein n=1 Tax=Lyophyllum shimeji TaxID=47721 RepID=A0A9P3PHZ5_LYOSH|nr:putative NAD-P-binding protein [Lyophyllum shimeji]